jgi:hypothetical protein
MDISSLIAETAAGYARESISTAIPAEVMKVSSFQGEQLIDAKPLIQRIYDDGSSLEPSTVPNVPVVFPSAGGGLLSFPIAVGDTVLLIYSMRSIEEWLEGTGANVRPLDSRSHHRSDAIAIPGLYTKSSNLSPSPTAVELKFKEMSVRLDPDNKLSLTSNASSVVLQANGDIDITAAGNVNISGAAINLN